MLTRINERRGGLPQLPEIGSPRPQESMENSNNNNNKKWSIYLIIGLVVVCLCIAMCLGAIVVMIAGGYLASNNASNFVETFESALQPSAMPTRPVITPPATPTINPLVTPKPTVASAPLDPDVAAEMLIIESQISALRGLDSVGSLSRALLTPEELHTQVEIDFFEDYTREEASEDVRELALLGLLEPGYDLYQLYIDLYSEQVAGYYDPEVKQMFVIADGDFSGPERMTYAHEYVHALQDQHYDLRNGLMINDDYCKTNTEYCAAMTALIEGDASIHEENWFFNLATEEDQQDVFDFYATYSSPVYDSAPAYLQEDFLFPYQQGAEFVNYLLAQGGPDALTTAYTSVRPQTTEQILHPEKYPDDQPTPIYLPDVVLALGEDWLEVDRNVMGEWYTYLILGFGAHEDARLDLDTAADAAAGWAGDGYLYLWNDTLSQPALVWLTEWETSRDTDEFWEALIEYGQVRWGAPSDRSSDEWVWKNTVDGYIRLERTSDNVLWLIAPDREAMDQIRDMVGIE